MNKKQAIDLLVNVQLMEEGAYLVDRDSILGKFEGDEEGLEDLDEDAFEDKDDPIHEWIKPVVKKLKALNNVDKIYALQGYESSEIVICTKEPEKFGTMDDSGDIKYGTYMVDSRDLKDKVLVLALDH